MNSKHLALLVGFVVLGSVVTSGAVAAAGDAGSIDDECEFPVTETDATGTEVTVEERPERIVTLQPSTTQIAWEIGISDRIVGAPVGEHIDYLEGYDEPEDVSQADDLTPSTERVVDVEPDLVVAAGVQDEEQIEQLRDANVTVFKFETPHTIEALYDDIRLVGQLTGACEGADETVEWMETEIGTAEMAHEGADRPLVFYPMGGGFTAGEGTFTDEIITAAGGENLGTKAGIEFYEVLSEETVVDEDPEWIVHPDSFDEPPVDREVLEATTAWENDRVVVVNASYMNQPGPRIVYPIQELAEAFHPEAYAEAQEEATDADDTAETDEEPTDADDTAETEEAQEAESEAPEDDQQVDESATEEMSGFGVAVGVVAVLLASLFAKRRR